MTSRRTRVAALVALAVAAPALSAVALTGNAPSNTPGTTGPTMLAAAYECTNNINTDVTELPVNADVEATRTSAERVDLTVSTGKLDFDLGSQTPNVALASRMDLVVDGTPTHVSGSSTVTLDPDNPPDFPVATGTATSTGATLTLVPGDLTIDIRVAGFPVTLACTAKGTAPTVTVPVDDPAATPEPTTAPSPRVKPGLTAKLTKKVQRVGRKPARVVVRVQRPKGATARPAGTVRVKVGKRVLTTRKVTGATRFRVTLPRKLTPGRHRVTVKFTPAKGSGYLPRTTKVRVRVKR